MLLSRRAFVGSPLLATAGTPTPSAPTWEPCAPMLSARSEMPAVAHDGWIYVAGGFTGQTRAERYHPDQDAWESISDLPIAVNHAGTGVFADQVVICGGYTDDGMHALDQFLAWDMDADAWISLGRLPEPIGAFGMTTFSNSLVLAGGATGHLGGTSSSAVWMRSPDSETWEACPTLTVGREHLTLVATDTHLIAIGGRAASTDESATGRVVEAWDGHADSWERLADLPHPRSGLAGAGGKDWAVVAGGETSQQTFDAVDLLASGAWSELPSLPTAVHGMGLARMGSDLYAIGGSTVAGQVASVADVYRINIGAGAG